MLVANGEIVGFVEVKPRDEPRRNGPEAFKRFCERHKIPFKRWIPGDMIPFLGEQVLRFLPDFRSARALRESMSRLTAVQIVRG